MAISQTKYNSQLEQYYGVVENITDLISNGCQPGEIAIISRKHKTLEGLLPLLNTKQIPYYYEKNNNVLENYHIQQIITIARYVNSIGTEEQGRIENLLPEILAYPFWELSSTTLWEISIECSKKSCSWLELMKESKNSVTNPSDKQKLTDIADYIIELAAVAKSQTAENMLDRFVGSGIFSGAEDEHDDSDPESWGELEQIASRIVDDETVMKKKYISPFKTFYFDKPLKSSLQGGKNTIGSDSYLSLLSSLRVLVQAVRNHRKKDVFKLSDLISFIDLVETNRIPLMDKQIFSNKAEAINLLSAHKAKGLEFEHVFVINVVKSEWENPGRSNKISFPANLPLEPDKDTPDDRVRLFFVALTRAKTNLYLTSYAFDESEKEMSEISFADIKWEIKSFDDKVQSELMEIYTFNADKAVIVTDSHKKLLYDLVDNYKLSVTNLINFLDVTAGGPLNFLETNLLRFPQAKSREASYGTAVHNAIRALYVEYARKTTLPPLDYFLNEFFSCLKTEGLSLEDQEWCWKQGQIKLQQYYQQRSSFFDLKSIIERDFKNYNVRVGDAEITGKLDKIDINEETKEIIVTDFKTGTGLKSWKNSEDYKRRKAWKYETQLLFYKVLVEHSNEFGGKYKVNKCALEFVSDPKTDTIVVLDRMIQEDEAKRMCKLIEAVYKKIVTLDFPDTSNYEQNNKGIEAFINDLIDGKI